MRDDKDSSSPGESEEDMPAPTAARYMPSKLCLSGISERSEEESRVEQCRRQVTPRARKEIHNLKQYLGEIASSSIFSPVSQDEENLKYPQASNEKMYDTHPVMTFGDQFG